MTRFEDLSGEILMAIFEFMNVKDVWTIFFNMNSRFNSLVFDSRLRLTADVSKIDRSNFDHFCSSLITTNFNNIFTLILSNNYNRYPQIRSFFSQTNLRNFQSLHALTLVDVNHDELIEVTKQIKDLPCLTYFHINTHEIFRDKELSHVTKAVLDHLNIRVSILCLHEKLQWPENETIPSCNAEVLSLDFINADRLLAFLPHCSSLRSLSATVDSRPSLVNLPDDTSIVSTIIPFAQITYLRLCFRPFDVNVLERLFQSLPNLRRLSMETLVYSIDYVRSPFWTLLFQKHLPALERIRLIIRGWLVLKTATTNNAIHSANYDKFDETNIIDGFRYDRYWLDRAYKRLFQYHVDSNTVTLQIR